MTPKIRAVFDRKKKASSTSTGKVEIEVIFSRTQRKTLSTGIELYSNQWEDGLVVRHALAKKLNSQISSLIKTYSNIIRQLIQNGDDVSYDNFSAALNIKSGKYGTDFIEFCYMTMEKRKLKELTIRAHVRTFESLRASGEDPNREQPTIYGYHKRLKPYINEAVKLGIIEESPYLRFKPERGKHKPKQALNEEELMSLRSLILNNKTLDKARDLFIFCCFTGLAHADMDAFDFNKDVVCVNGMYYIDKRRVKTGTQYYTPILPPAMSVLEKYDYELPTFAQQTYNRLLKCLGDMINLRKNLSSHIARYTFATTVLLAHEVPIESVSKMLGHTRIQITQLYAKILNTSIEKQAERLSGII